MVVSDKILVPMKCTMYTKLKNESKLWNSNRILFNFIGQGIKVYLVIDKFWFTLKRKIYLKNIFDIIN